MDRNIEILAIICDYFKLGEASYRIQKEEGIKSIPECTEPNWFKPSKVHDDLSLLIKPIGG